MWTIILKKVQFELTKKKFNFFQRPFLVEPCLDRTTSLRRHKIFPFIIFPFTFFPFLAHSNNENVLSTFPFAKCLSSDDSFFVFVFGGRFSARISAITLLVCGAKKHQHIGHMEESNTWNGDDESGKDEKSKFRP